MKKTYLLGSMILSILAIVAVVIILSVTGVMGTDEQIPLVFSTESQSKTYDGEPLVNNKWKLESGELKKGHVAVPTVYGSQTNAGSSDNGLSVKIIDENEADVTSDYRIEYRVGKLTVTQRPIKIASDSASKQYDGAPITCNSYRIISGRLLTGHRLSVEFGMSRTEVGVTENIIDIRILDSAGGDVTANYDVDAIYGSLHISGYPLTVKTGSDEKVYDGAMLVCNEYDILSGEIRDGHTLSVTVLGSQTAAGESDNTLSVQIYDESGADVTRLYDINPVLGTLKVTKRDITVSTPSKAVTYAEAHASGGVLTLEEYYVSDGLIYGHEAFVTVTGRVEGVGKAENSCLVEILDENSYSVTSNYNIIRECGQLEVLPVDIAVSSGSAYITYDEFIRSNKMPLTSGEYSVSVASLLEGHEIKIEVNGKQATVGKSENTFTVAILDEKGKDVSHLYEIESVFGELEIGKIDLTLGSTSATKEYDGEPLSENSEDDWWIAAGELYPGHKIVKATMSTVITNADRVKNTVNLTIFDENDIDVTGCYNIIDTQLGYLEITPHSLFVTSEGYSDMYNGQCVRNETYYITGGYEELLAREHTIEVIFTEYPVDAGEYLNTMEFIIRNKEGKEITENYAIKKTEGTISIAPRVVTVRTESASKLYDGEPLTAPGWEIVSETKPIEGHELVVVVTGEQTEIGKSDNCVAELRVVVTNEGHRDITKNYDLSGLQVGVLTVKDPSATGNGNGLPTDPTSPPAQYDGEGILLAKIKSSTTGSVYLKEMSFGDYNGQYFDLASSYSVCIENRYAMSYLTALALGTTMQTNQRMDIEYLSTRYFLPYYLDTEELDCAEQKSDVYYDDPACISASLFYYDYWYSSDNPPPQVPKEYRALEEKYREYVYDTYLSLDGFSKTEAYLTGIIKEQGFDRNDPEVLDAVASYIQGCATYNLKYDADLDTEDDVVLAFMTEYKEGVCRHYAMAATLLLRTLGIPARYTVGVYSEVEAANQWVEVYSNTGHAWTEAYIDGVGWVALEVTGSDRSFPQDGDGSTTGGGSGAGGGDNDGGNAPIRIEIEPRVEPVLYKEGFVLTATPENTKLSGNNAFYDLVKRGYTFACEVEGSLSDVGYAPVTITGVKMFSPDGEEIVDSDKFVIYTKEGRLHMYEAALTVQSFDITSDYTGDYIVNTHYQHSPLLSDSHYIEVEFGLGRIDAGTAQNYFACKVFEDIDGVKTDITYRYLITKSFGTITVNPMKITLTADNTQITYDELMNVYGGTYDASAYTVEGTLFEGHSFKYVIQSGSLSKKGRQETIISDVKIIDGDGRDVTANYTITFKKGLIRVVK